MEANTAAPMSGPAVAERLVLDEPLRERLIEIAAHRFRLDRETAEDLLQETAIELVRSAGLIQKPDGFAYRVFYTRCCHYLDRETGRRALRERAGPPTARPHTGEADALDLGITLRQALAQVSPTCRSSSTSATSKAARSRRRPTCSTRPGAVSPRSSRAA